MAARRRVFYLFCIFFTVIANNAIPASADRLRQDGDGDNGFVKKGSLRNDALKNDHNQQQFGKPAQKLQGQGGVPGDLPQQPAQVRQNDLPPPQDNQHVQYQRAQAEQDLHARNAAPQQQFNQQQFDQQQQHRQNRVVNPAVGQGPNRGRPASPAKFRIADDPRCVHAVASFCSSIRSNNFAVLDCLQSDEQKYDKIGNECQNLLWEYKRNLTLDDRFSFASEEVCRKTLESAEFAECKDSKVKGHVISCLVEHKDKVEEKNCLQFLDKMASIIFSDYRLLSPFVEECAGDVTKYKCGRLDSEKDIPHKQGSTVSCLEKNFSELAEKCQTQLLRLAELQASDYHHDRPVYYACREDRELFCKDVQAGDGKVFKCLYKHKMKPQMSNECREKLTARQNLIQKDYKVSYTFLDTCKDDIKSMGCNKLGAGQPSFKQGRMARTLLCLEDGMRQGKQVNPKCLREIDDWRRSLMEDYQISPNIVSDCHTEITEHCRGMQRNGKTLHCLMELARPSKQKFQDDEPAITPKCKAALRELVEEADPGSDLTVDPAIMEACGAVAKKLCKDTPPGTGEALGCLMDNIDAQEVTQECKERLLEVQYFLSRDFRLDKKLFRQCREDAVNLDCAVKEDFKHDHNKATAEKGPLILACLFSQAREKNIQSRSCAAEIRRVMRERTVSIDLEPEIEQSCMHDLSTFCSESEHVDEKGGEMDCLEEHLEELSQDCRTKVGEFIGDADEDPLMDRLLMKACMPMLEKFCKAELGDSEPEEIMECLIEHKNHPDMNSKCTCGVEHHQLITMKDFTFSHKFKVACKEPAKKFCKMHTKKAEVVYCLSELVFNDTMLDAAQRVPPECRKQLRSELLSESEVPELDPKFMKACEGDMETYCKNNVKQGQGHMEECLKRKKKDISQSCHVHLFKRERLEMAVAGGDYTLMHGCKSMIKLHCQHEDAPGMINCLKQFMNTPGFDLRCKKLLDEKLILQHQDYRLNPELHKACRLDVPKFCHEAISGHIGNGGQPKAQELEGVVIQCLKEQFAKKNNRLSPGCSEQVSLLIHEAQLDFRKDPVLGIKCAKEIKELCAGPLKEVEDGHEDQGLVEECLKENIQKIDASSMCLFEVIRLFIEGRADVHVDPHLNEACSVDLEHYCKDVPKGLGRKMSCLLSALDDSAVRLTPKCKRELEKRRELWSYAAKVAPERMSDIYDMIMDSPAKSSFLGLVFAVIAIVLILGLFCGRVTKRVPTSVKNK